MTYSKRKKPATTTEQKMEEKDLEVTETEETKFELPEALVVEETVPVPEPTTEPPRATGKIFVGEEDKRLLKKFNSHIVKKLGVGGNRSYKI
jgi:hypothetical protein